MNKENKEILRTLRATGEAPAAARGGHHLRGWIARRAGDVTLWSEAGHRGYPPHSVWAQLRGRRHAPPRGMRPQPLPLTLSAADERAAAKFGRAQRPRKKYWAYATADASRDTTAPAVVEDRRDVGANHPGWNPTECRVIVPARIVRGSRRTCVVTAWDFQAGAMVQRRLRAPRGYSLGADDEGVYLSRDGFAVHLDSGCWRPGGMRAAAAEWRRLEGVRRAAVRSAGATLRIPRRARSASVTLADAAAAGHCRAGTVAWCRARGIPTRGATLAVLAPYMGDERVARVVRRVMGQLREGQGDKALEQGDSC